jgi:hypothetical protein
VVIFSRPLTSLASDSSYNQQLVPLQVRLPDQNLVYKIEPQQAFTLLPSQWENEVVYFNHWSNNPQQIILASKDEVLETVTLGEKVEIIASNQGIYSYTIYNLRLVKSQDLLELKNETNANLIIITPQNWLGTTNLVALAK